MKRTSMIERYLEGSMTEEEKTEFEKRMGIDKKLASEVALHKNINNAIKEDDVYHLRLNIRSLIRGGKSHTNKVRIQITRYLRYPIAAAIILLIGFSLWQIISDKSSPEIYNMFYHPYQTDILTRSGDQQVDKVQLSYLLYQEGDYEASFEILTNYLTKNHTNQTARFYYGMNAIELQQLDLAIKELKTVAEDLSTPFSLHAKWYLAMAYLKINRKEEASKYLQQLTNTTNLYTEKASRILRML